MHFLLFILPVALATSWAQTKQNYTESFESVIPGRTCSWYGTCPDYLPGPTKGLLWQNLNVIQPKYFGVACYDGVYCADIVNPAMPVPISAGPCTQSFRLSSFALACPYNCTAVLTGWNNGFVGEEQFEYIANPFMSGTQPGGPVWQERLYNVTAGLYGKNLRNLSILVTNTSTYDPYPYGYTFTPALDYFQYEVTNKTIVNGTQC